MATQEELLAKIRRLNQLRDREIANRLGSAPGTLKSAREGTAADAHAYQQQFRPGPGSPGVDPMEIAKGKEKLLAQLADLEKGRQAGRAGIGKELASKDPSEKLKVILGFISDIKGSENSATASIAASANSAKAKLADAEIRALNSAVGNEATSREVGNTMRRLSEVVGSQVSPEGAMRGTAVTEPAYWAAVGDMVAQAEAQSINNPAAMRGLLIGIDQDLRKQGFANGLEDDISTGPGLGSDRPERELDPMALDTFNSLQRRAREMDLNAQALNQMKMEATADIAKETAAEFARGVGQLGDPQFDKLMNMALRVGDGVEVDAEDITDAMDAFAKEGAPSDPDAVRRIHDALGELDDLANQPNIPASAREAREELFSDPGFRKFMEDNGISDPGMGLKALREVYRKKLSSDKASDRKRLQEIRDSPGGFQFDDSAREEGRAAEAEVKKAPASAAPPVPEGASATPMPPPADGDELAGKRVSPSGGKEPGQGGIIGKLAGKLGGLDLPGQEPDEQAEEQFARTAPQEAFAGRKIRKRLADKIRGTA